jgi:hypothetical protein
LKSSGRELLAVSDQRPAFEAARSASLQLCVALGQFRVILRLDELRHRAAKTAKIETVIA